MKQVTVTFIPFLEVRFARELGTVRGGSELLPGVMWEPPSVHTSHPENIRSEQEQQLLPTSGRIVTWPSQERSSYFSSCYLSPTLLGKEAAAGGERKDVKTRPCSPLSISGQSSHSCGPCLGLGWVREMRLESDVTLKFLK